MKRGAKTLKSGRRFCHGTLLTGRDNPLFSHRIIRQFGSIGNTYVYIIEREEKNGRRIYII